MFNRVRLGLLILGSALAAAAPLQAATIAVTGPTSGSNAGAGWTIGYGFTPTDDLTVTMLGVFDIGADGLVSDTPVGLWTNGGTLLGSVVVPGGTASPLESGIRFASLSSPINLNQGDLYRIASNNFPGNENVWLLASGYTVAPEINLTGTAYLVSVSDGSTLSFPTQATTSNQFKYLGPSFQYDLTTPIPEPTTLALFGIGLAGLVAWRRKRRKA